jgi:hypothetical protein
MAKVCAIRSCRAYDPAFLHGVDPTPGLYSLIYDEGLDLAVANVGDRHFSFLNQLRKFGAATPIGVWSVFDGMS